jgi:hypothetical protein
LVCRRDRRNLPTVFVRLGHIAHDCERRRVGRMALTSLQVIVLN